MLLWAAVAVVVLGWIMEMAEQREAAGAMFVTGCALSFFAAILFMPFRSPTSSAVGFSGWAGAIGLVISAVLLFILSLQESRELAIVAAALLAASAFTLTATPDSAFRVARNFASRMGPLSKEDQRLIRHVYPRVKAFYPGGRKVLSDLALHVEGLGQQGQYASRQQLSGYLGVSRAIVQTASRLPDDEVADDGVLYRSSLSDVERREAFETSAQQEPEVVCADLRELYQEKFDADILEDLEKQTPTPKAKAREKKVELLPWI